MITAVMLQGFARRGESIDMEACFSQLTLDVIGKSVFNYDFNALTADSPLIQVPSPISSCNTQRVDIRRACRRKLQALLSCLGKHTNCIMKL